LSTSAIAQRNTTSVAHAATLQLSNNTYARFNFKVHVITTLACNMRLRVTSSAGTVTPQAGSFYYVRELPVTTGAFAA
jgi:hypothetical protein